MMRRYFRQSVLFGLLLLFAAGALHALTPAALTVVSAGPTGELRQLQDANEIRVIFSEPMVPLGRIPSNPTPPWIQITPAIPGTWRWSGTTILIFTPDPAKPLPHATEYTVTVGAQATSASGQPLGTPYVFRFTTPTVRLTSARWARQGARYVRPVALALQFNQRVRPEDVVAHLEVRYRPHAWEEPVMTAGERKRLAAMDAAGLKRFETKLAVARANAARTDRLAVRVATDWDRKRFPPSDRLVVLETTTVPPPGTWLQLTLDRDMPSPEGPARPPAPQSSTAELDPVFFARTIRCRVACNPSGYNAVELSAQVDAAAFARALSVRDVTNPAAESPVNRMAAPAPTAGRETSSMLSVEDAGFDRQPPARTWLLHLDPALAAIDGQTLDYPWIGIVENWHERAFTSFGDGHGVWEAAGGPQLPFSSRNYRTITQHLVRLDAGDLMPRILALAKGGFRQTPPGQGTRRTLPVKPDAIQAHGLDLTPVLSARGTGLAWAAIVPGEAIERSSPIDVTRATVVQATNLGISVKDSPQSTLVFVTRLDNGEAVADANVTIVNTENRHVWRGRTGRDGVAMAPALPLRDPSNWYELSFLVTAEKDGDVAYVASDWHEGIMPWEFGHNFQLWEAIDILRGSVFTDRGVYKPGEQIHVKAIVRADTPTGVRLMPEGSDIEIRVHDSRNKEVDRRTVKLSRWSSAEWTWTVPAEATLGNYRIQAALPGAVKPEGNDLVEHRPDGRWLKQLHGSFLVAAYRRPDFRVDTTLTADPPIAGDPLRATLDARYLFGSAMAKRPVTWSLTRTVMLSLPDAVRERYPDDKFVFGYYPDRGERGEVRVAGDETTLDANGHLRLDLPTERGTDLTHQYTFEGDVEDISRQHIANRSSAIVYPAPWHVGIRRPDYFADVQKGTNVGVVAVDHAGAAVSGVTVKLSLLRIQWNSVRRAEGSGFYTWETQRIETPAGDWTVSSGPSPVDLHIPLAEGGSYVLRATAEDAQGHRTRTDVWFYALGRGYTAWQRFDHNRITLEPERRTWKPGERARVMIQSPWESATALLTVEREGVRSYERFTLTSTQQTVEVPLTEDDIPNVFVSVLLVRGRTSNDLGADGDDPGRPAFRLGYTELTVEDATKRLNVAVAADREEYRPANTAKVSVAITDAAGNPARSEVTLWAVDYGVLSLTGYQAPDVLRAVYQKKALQVLTTDSRQRIISRRVLTPKGANEGGGGGDEGAVRTDFRPLAFWLGSVETDARGRASREVKLPESLTTYRIMAVAADTASRFGTAGAEIRVSKPVTLLPAFPRFLTRGDRASFGTVVTNTLPSGGSARVEIRSLDPAIVRFDGESRREVRLEAGGSEAVRFDATALMPGTARIRVSVSLGRNSDAFETSLAVTAPARMETVAAFGDTDSRTSERLTIPSPISATAGGLQVDLASTALVGLGEGARYLANYPYACAEQKASSALALMLASDLGAAFSMDRIEPAGYRRKAEALLADLPRYQCSDGGFGSWPGPCLFGQVYLTSYVLHVMHVGRELGITLDSEVVERALTFLDNAMRAPEPQQVQHLPAWTASIAFGTKVLAEYKRNVDPNVTRLYRHVDRLPVFGLTYLADAMAAGTSRGARYDDVVRRLANALRVEGDRAHVEEIDDDALMWLWNSNVRSTALVLDGFVRRGDQPLHVPRLVRSLLGARQNGRWRNTQENATALEALVRYYKTFEAEPPDFSASVTLGPRAIGSARFQGRSTVAQQVRLAMPDLLRRIAQGAEHELTIARAGTGRVYYTARLQFVPLEPPPPSDQGIHLERRYERYVEGGEGPVSTTFNAGDLVRVTLAVTLPKERRFVAVSDMLPAGFEAVDGWFRTTAGDLARDASQQPSNTSWIEYWRRGGFEHVEKHDDRVLLFATRLSEGRHEFSYLVRATTSGTFQAAGTWAEEMYAPEVNGRTAAATVVIK
jgi:uncharacterized protein YfaS (alpha-2-macroglobulin family)